MPWITIFATGPDVEAALTPGRLFTVRTSRLPYRICLVRLPDRLVKTEEEGSLPIRAFLDACPHKLAAFSRGGHLNGNGDIVCPLHHYTFELRHGECMSGHGCGPLQTFPCRANEAGGLEVLLP